MRLGLKPVLAAAAVMAVCGGSGVAVAQAPRPQASQLMLGLQNQQSNLSNDGFARAAGPLYGELASQRARQFNVMLRAGIDYTIAGVCDNQCGDLDIRLIDPNASIIASDIQGNAAPTLRVRPQITGEHVIQVSMARCDAPSCWFAVNIYAR